ncbi:MAG TPA: PilT/PilU family type 4a pilus ATPase [Chthoniobacterales bacterium]|nr:PilT/PilU family type 4a pilus ATPase [Chthoniobacterales bacterium]
MNATVIDSLLGAMVESEGVSDLLFAVGRPPLVEMHGTLHEFPIDTPEGILSAAHIDQLVTHLIAGDERLTDDLNRSGSCDCGYALENVARFRVNIFRQRGRKAIVMRKLQTEIPTLDGLGLPPVFKKMIQEKNGIIFVTGATGSGKTTTLAAMLNELNHTQQIHIVTLEDPIEFVHPHQKALFNQRELGKDFSDFASGLRASLRQSPKAILVGEIRDRETMEIALTASETGHVVFSTLHTISAGQTIKRILGMYDPSEEALLRQRLAETLRFVVSQRLVTKIGGGRLLIMEIMGSSLRTREAIVYGEGENRTFQEIIEAGTPQGWQTFDQSLIEAFKQELITDETALLYSAHKNKMTRDIDMLKRLRNQIRDEPSGLQMASKPAESAMPGMVPVLQT